MAPSHKQILRNKENFPVSPIYWVFQNSAMSKSKNPHGRDLRKGRHPQTGRIYFITTSTKDRLPWFIESDLASLMSGLIESYLNNKHCRCLCWVVMPDHIHLLIELQSTMLAGTINRLKSGSARILNRQIGRAGPFWQSGFDDHALRREEDIKEVARYIVGNPIRAGLVEKFGDYPFWNAVWL